MSDIWFCGDNHSRFLHIIDAVKSHRPIAIVLLGDVQAKRPLQIELSDILSDTKCIGFPETTIPIPRRTTTICSNPISQIETSIGGWSRSPACALPASVESFAKKCGYRPAKPIHDSAKEFLRVAGKGNRWRGGLPLRHRSTISLTTTSDCRASRPTCWSTHEAPGAHPHGNEALELLAMTMGATKLYHGHTHDALAYDNPQIRLCGVGLCGITSIDGTKIVPGELDDARSNRQRFK